MLRHALLALAIATASVAAVIVPERSGERARWRAPLIASDSVLGVFEGRTPCGTVATAFTGFPSQNCEKIKWRLTLYRHPVTGAPSSYRYEGTRTSHAGRWRSAAGTGPQGGRTIHHLTPDGASAPLSVLSIEDKVLLILDRHGDLLVGDASWSYVLNRIEPSR
jgi:hypothetical protein